MESTLSPRDIQSRIRAGETIEEVALAAGVPSEKISLFANPVLAERDYMAQSSHQALLRLRGDGAHRPLITVIAEKMTVRGLDPDQLTWDAYRLPDRTWRVCATLTMDPTDREAWFTFDPKGRFCVCANQDARWLVGEEPIGAETTPDTEPTVDLNDELALVRATSPKPEPAPTTVADEITDIDEVTDVDPGESFPEPDSANDVYPTRVGVDGLYDIIGPGRNRLDEFYDMLHEFAKTHNEPYSGPLSDLPAAIDPLDFDEIIIDDEVNDEDDFESHTRLDEEPTETIEQLPATSMRATKKPANPKNTPQSVQDTLIGDPAERPKARRRTQRASVPAWDDILFGGSKKD